MLSKIKDLLNNSIIWLLALMGGIFYFWKKERDLENKLAISNATKDLEKLKGEQKQIDESADAALADYQRKLDEYNRNRSGN